VGTGFDANITNATGQEGVLTATTGSGQYLNIMGTGTPDAYATVFSGNSGFTATYDFAHDPNTITVSAGTELPAEQVHRATAPQAGLAPAPAAAAPLFPVSNGKTVNKPSTITMNEDGTNHTMTVTGITWSSWGPNAAYGVGSFMNNSGATLQFTFTLSQPVNGLFTSLTVTSSAAPGSPTTTTWPSSAWPVSAY
jgi:hypothetical protein